MADYGERQARGLQNERHGLHLRPRVEELAVGHTHNQTSSGGARASAGGGGGGWGGVR